MAASVVNPQDASILSSRVDTPTERSGSYLEAIEEQQAAYIAYLGQGYGKRLAARLSGYTFQAALRPNKVIETHELRAKAQSALKRQGATLDKAARVVSEAMNAKATATFEGEVIESEVPDHKVRVQAAKLTADLMGLGESSRTQQAGSSLALTISGPLAERFMEHIAGKADSIPMQGITLDAEV